VRPNPRLQPKVLACAALVVAIGALVLKLAVAPLYKMYDAEECHGAYARAHSRADTARVDLHPFAAPSDPRNGRCGEVRALQASTPAEIPALRQDDEDL